MSARTDKRHKLGHLQQLEIPYRPWLNRRYHRATTHTPRHSFESTQHNGVHLMPIDRSLGRNVHFYDASKPGVALGGLIQNGSVTETNFLEMLFIVLVTEAPLRVQGRTGHVVATTDNPLQPGEYDVYCDGRCSLSGSFNHLLILKQVELRSTMSHGCIASSCTLCRPGKMPFVMESVLAMANALFQAS